MGKAPQIAKLIHLLLMLVDNLKWNYLVSLKLKSGSSATFSSGGCLFTILPHGLQVGRGAGGSGPACCFQTILPPHSLKLQILTSGHPSITPSSLGD